jgi:hypothetical protein
MLKVCEDMVYNLGAGFPYDEVRLNNQDSIAVEKIKKCYNDM